MAPGRPTWSSGRLSFEGHAIYPNGVIYYGDELAPSNGVAGGAYFKFVPTTLRDPSAGPITGLDQSPLAAGEVFGLRVGGAGHHGQGSQYALGAWVEIPAAPDPDLRAQSRHAQAHRPLPPEDLDVDRTALADSRIRFCGNYTGDEGAQNWERRSASPTARCSRRLLEARSPRYGCSFRVARRWPCPTTPPSSPVVTT